MRDKKEGGLCFVGSRRHVVANNKYLENFETKPSNYILYEDANNLYAHSMIQSLPFENSRIDTNIDIKDIKYWW